MLGSPFQGSVARRQSRTVDRKPFHVLADRFEGDPFSFFLSDQTTSRAPKFSFFFERKAFFKRSGIFSEHFPAPRNIRQHNHAPPLIESTIPPLPLYVGWKCSLTDKAPLWEAKPGDKTYEFSFLFFSLSRPDVYRICGPLFQTGRNSPSGGGAFFGGLGGVLQFEKALLSPTAP